MFIRHLEFLTETQKLKLIQSQKQNIPNIKKQLKIMNLSSGPVVMKIFEQFTKLLKVKLYAT